MAGVTSIHVHESLAELEDLLSQTKVLVEKERLQVLYWLKQDNPPSISTIAKAVGKHRNTVGTWLRRYRHGGIPAMLEQTPSTGRPRIIPQWAEDALERRLRDPNHGFASYGAVQKWLAQTLGIEAQYHAVYQMTRYRLKAKLKVARPQNKKQNQSRRDAFKKRCRPI